MRQWGKNRRVGSNTFGVQMALQKIAHELGKNRRRVLGMPQPTVDTAAYFPFKVYQPDPPSSAGIVSAGKTYGTIFDNFGNSSVIAIDATVPTNLPTTVNPGTDGWRFLSVRGGYFYYRGLYSLFPSGSGYLSSEQYHIYPDPGGIDGVTIGSDWVAPNYPALEQPFDSQSKVSLWNTFFSTDGSPIIINGTWNGSTQILFAIWLDVPPETPSTGFGPVQLKAMRFDAGYGTLPTIGFPFKIPIAYISTGIFNTAYSYTINQIQWGHIALQYGAGLYDYSNPGSPVSTDPICGPLLPRGNWSTDAITSQAFYPGDIVIINQTLNFGGSVGSKTNRQLWMMTQTGFTANPATDPNWVQIAGL